MAVLTAEGLDPLDLEAWGDGSCVTQVEVGGPDSRDVVFDRPSADGSNDLTAHVGARAVTLGVSLATGAHTRRALVDRMAPFMHPARRITLRLTTDGVERSLTVRPDPVSLPWNRPGILDLTWSFRTVGSPYFHGETRTVPVAPSPPAPGSTFNWVFNVEFPPAPVQFATVHQAGNVDADWVATITGPCTSPAIRNEVTGDEVRLTGLTLQAGQTCVVDAGARTVTVDGQARYSAVDTRVTRWWQIPPGTTRVNAPVNTAGAEASIVLTYTDVYYA